MATIRKIFKSDLYGLFHNFFALVIAVGLCILPALYAWFNIYANWDPYANTGNIRIAVVVQMQCHPGFQIVHGLLQPGLQQSLTRQGLNGRDFPGRAPEGDAHADLVVVDDERAVVGHVVHGVGPKGLRLGHLVGRLGQIALQVALVVDGPDGALGLPGLHQIQNGLLELGVVLHRHGVGLLHTGGGAGVGRHRQVMLRRQGAGAEGAEQKDGKPDPFHGVTSGGIQNEELKIKNEELRCPLRGRLK